MRANTTGSGPIPGAGQEGPRRSRTGTSGVPLWNRTQIGLFVLGVIVLLGLPIFGPPSGATPAKRVRGIRDVPIQALPFAPDGKTIATIQ